MGRKTVKARLAPPQSQWHNCCVPIDVIIRTSKVAVQKRRMLLNAVLFLIYAVTLLITVIALSPSQPLFMSNARAASDVMFWQRADVPQTIIRVLGNDSSYSVAQWLGPRVAGSDVNDWRQYETWAQTRMLYFSPCLDKSTLDTCAYPTLVQQSRSSEFTECIPWAQTEFEDNLICLAGVTLNCFQGASKDSNTCNSNQANLYSPLIPFPFSDESAATCPISGYGVFGGCDVVGSCGWSNTIVPLEPVAVGRTFNTLEGANKTLDGQSRFITIADSVIKKGDGFSYSTNLNFQAQATLSGALSVAGKILTQSDYAIPESVVVASGFVAAAMLFDLLTWFRRLIFHPLSLLTPWLPLDIVLFVFYVILFIVLNNSVWNRVVFSPISFGPNTTNSVLCDLANSNIDDTNYSQLIGALVALSFLTIFRFMTLLRFSRLALKSLVVSIKSLSWALVIIAIVYLLNALACMVFFGQNSDIFRLLGNAFFTTLILPEGFDVNFIANQMELALPSHSPIPGLYFTLVVFVINRCVTAMVTALVAIGYITTKYKDDRRQQNANSTTLKSNIDASSGGSGSLMGENDSGDSHLAVNDQTSFGPTSSIGKQAENELRAKSFNEATRSRSVTALTRYAWERLSGTRAHETVGLEIATEKIIKWSQKEENLLRSFITYEELKMVISIVDDTVRVKVNDEQVSDFFARCGLINIYYIEDAMKFERAWMDDVNLEGGKGGKYKRHKADAIAIQASRIADFAADDDATTTGDAEGDEITTRIRATRQLLESLKIKKVNLDQVLEPMLADIAKDQRILECDMARLATHFELTNLLRRLGVPVIKDAFQVRTGNDKNMTSGLNGVSLQPNRTYSADNIVCRTPGIGGDEFAFEIVPSASDFDDLYRETLRRLKKQAKETVPMLDRFIRVCTEDWLALDAEDIKAAYTFFLIKGGQLTIGKPSMDLVRMPRTPLQTVTKDRHIFMVAVLRHGERAEDDPRWHSLSSIREGAKQYDLLVKERCTIKFFEESGFNPRSFLRKGEFLEEIALHENEEDCYIVLKVDVGLTFTYIEEQSQLYVALERANYDVGDDALEDSIVLTEIEGLRVRSLSDLAQAKLSFRPTISSAPPRYNLSFVVVGPKGETLTNKSWTNPLLS